MNWDRCILVAEDDENDIIFLERAFAQAKILNPLQFVHDGQMAIDYLSGAGKFAGRDLLLKPCLVMLDLKMPRKTGMQVLQWIRTQESLRSIPVIMFSSSVHPAEIEDSYQNGVNAFVTKPSGIPERTELARLIKDFWLTANQLP